ncbi:MAG: ABC transporter permease, partial [Actinomycetota bacterium]
MTQIATEPILGPEQEPAEIGGAPSGKVTGRSPWQLFWRRFRKDKFALAGIGVIILMVAIALTAGIISAIEGTGPNELSGDALDEVGLPIGPAGGFLFGADTAGGDLFVRVMYGARTSLTVALLATGLEVVIGVMFGLLAGFYRGKVDTFVSRLIDIVLSLPILLLALGLVAACSLSREGCLGGIIRPGIVLVSYVIALFGWPYIARIVRGQVLSLREKEFVEAARAQGSGDLRIMFRDILPNVAAPIIVYT